MLTLVVIVVVSAALIVGAAWGICWGLSEKTEGFLVALAGGSLLVSTVLERSSRRRARLHSCRRLALFSPVRSCSACLIGW